MKKRIKNREIKIDWYQRIEKPIRPLVKLLRDNGYNTTCSCGHEMYVMCDYDFAISLWALYNLLYENGYKQFKIELICGRNNAIGIYKSFAIYLLKKDGKFTNSNWESKEE